MTREGHRAATGQPLPMTEVVVEEQAQANHPRRAQASMMRQHKAQRPDYVWGGAQQSFPLLQGLAHQPKLVVL